MKWFQIFIRKFIFSRNTNGPNVDCDTDQEDFIDPNLSSLPSASNAHTSSYTNDGEIRDDGYSDTSSDSDFEYTYTPKRRCVSASDSGCATAPSSSTSSSSAKHPKSHKVCSNSNRISDDEYVNIVEKFRKRVRKVRMNIKRKFCADSDSNWYLL